MFQRLIIDVDNTRITRDVHKTLCPLKLFFVTDVLYNWTSQFKISCTNL